MSRMVGTVSRGIRAPIIRSGDDLVEIVTGCSSMPSVLVGGVPLVSLLAFCFSSKLVVSLKTYTHSCCPSGISKVTLRICFRGYMMIGGTIPSFMYGIDLIVL